MNTLITLLRHPYHVLNHLAEDLYAGDGSSAVAAHQRLRSRAIGRHGFTRPECEGLIDRFVRLMYLLHGLAAMLRHADPDYRPDDWLALLAQPWLNQAEILKDVAAPLGLSQLQAYDMLRGRRRLSEARLLPALAIAYEQHAAWLRAQIEQAQAERAHYTYSQGPGKPKKA